jgi:hypothetical protein
LLIDVELPPAGHQLDQQTPATSKTPLQQGIGQILADRVAELDQSAVLVGVASQAKRPGLSTGLGIGAGIEP